MGPEGTTVKSTVEVKRIFARITPSNPLGTTLGTLAIAALLHSTLENHNFGALMRNIIDVYGAVKSVFFGWAEPYLRIPLSYANLRLAPEWRDLCVLWICFAFPALSLPKNKIEYRGYTISAIAFIGMAIGMAIFFSFLPDFLSQSSEVDSRRYPIMHLCTFFFFMVLFVVGKDDFFKAWGRRLANIIMGTLIFFATDAGLKLIAKHIIP
jgi:hypothetical protein